MWLQLPGNHVISSPRGWGGGAIGLAISFGIMGEGYYRSVASHAMLWVIYWCKKVALNRVKVRSLSTWMITIRCETLEHAIMSSSFSHAWPGWGDCKVSQQLEWKHCDSCFSGTSQAALIVRPNTGGVLRHQSHPFTHVWLTNILNFQWFLVISLFTVWHLSLLIVLLCTTRPTAQRIQSPLPIE